MGPPPDKDCRTMISCEFSNFFALKVCVTNCFALLKRLLQSCFIDFPIFYEISNFDFNFPV